MIKSLPPEAYGELNEGITRVLFTAEAIEAKVYTLGEQISAAVKSTLVIPSFSSP